MKDLQGVYRATTKELAERHLDQLSANWGARYPKVIESWKKNWPRLSSYFQYNKEIRRIMYTTNIIEGFHRQPSDGHQNKGCFPERGRANEATFPGAGDHHGQME